MSGTKTLCYIPVWIIWNYKMGKWYQIVSIDGKLTKGCQGKGDVEKTWRNVKQFLPKTLKGMRVLDLGCNAGAYCVNSILMGAKEVVGIEVSDTYFKQALLVKKHMEKKHGGMNIRYIHGAIHEHIGGLGSFDVIYAFSILYHIRREHIDAVCKHVAESTENIIARFRNENDISKYSKMFGELDFQIHKRFEEVGLFRDGRKKYLVQYKKRIVKTGKIYPVS